MKLLSRFVKRRKWRDAEITNSKSENSNRLLTKSTSRTHSLSPDDTAGSFTDREDALPSWKAGNFLNKTLCESDWWEDDDSSDDDESSVGESTTSESSYSSKELTPLEAIPGKVERRFRNRGLETWKQGRRAWCSEGRGQWHGKNKSKPIPASFQKELVKCLADRRQFELSQPISLADMIEAYTIVWSKEE